MTVSPDTGGRAPVVRVILWTPAPGMAKPIVSRPPLLLALVIASRSVQSSAATVHAPPDVSAVLSTTMLGFDCAPAGAAPTPRTHATTTTPTHPSRVMPRRYERGATAHTPESGSFSPDLRRGQGISTQTGL